MSVDRWFMLFSLLSAASSGKSGRPYVWAAIAYLVENDLVNDSNFTACRHLVLRFVQGWVFSYNFSSLYLLHFLLYPIGFYNCGVTFSTACFLVTRAKNNATKRAALRQPPIAPIAAALLWTTGTHST